MRKYNPNLWVAILRVSSPPLSSQNVARLYCSHNTSHVLLYRRCFTVFLCLVFTNPLAVAWTMPEMCFPHNALPIVELNKWILGSRGIQNSQSSTVISDSEFYAQNLENVSCTWIFSKTNLTAANMTNPVCVCKLVAFVKLTMFFLFSDCENQTFNVKTLVRLYKSPTIMKILAHYIHGLVIVKSWPPAQKTQMRRMGVD